MEEFEIFRYTRADAIADGVLIDVSERAKEFGFVIPVAVNDNANAMLQIDRETADRFGSDYQGRLSDLLYSAYMAVRRSRTKRENIPELLFDVVLPQHAKATLFDKPHGEHPAGALVKFKMMIHGGDSGEPVITIMRPNDD